MARFLWAFGLQSPAMKGNSLSPLRIPAPRKPEPPDPVTPEPPAEASEKWLQQTLAVHTERDERLAAYWEEKLLKNLLATCNETGWKPLYDFEAGLQQTVDWYRRNVGWLKGVTRS
jgi:hypothetical protein